MYGRAKRSVSYMVPISASNFYGTRTRSGGPARYPGGGSSAPAGRVGKKSSRVTGSRPAVAIPVPTLTKTRTKITMRSRKVQEGGNAGGLVFYYGKKAGLAKKKRAPYVWHQVLSGHLESAAGLQALSNMGRFNGRGQFLSTGSTPWESLHRLIYMEPNAKLTGTKDTTVPAGTVRPNLRFKMISNTVHYRFTNNGATTAFLELFVLVQKKSIQGFPDNLLNVALQDEGMGAALVTEGGPGTYQAGTTGYPDREIWGTGFSDVPDIKKICKVVKYQKMILAPGTTEDFTITGYLNKIVDERVVNESPENIAGLTWHVMYRLSGSVVRDVTEATHRSTLGSTEVSWVASFRSRMAPMKEVKKQGFTLCQTAPPTLTTLANQQYYNQDVDTVVVVKEAE